MHNQMGRKTLAMIILIIVMILGIALRWHLGGVINWIESIILLLIPLVFYKYGQKDKNNTKD